MLSVTHGFPLIVIAYCPIGVTVIFVGVATPPMIVAATKETCS
jgi:hypothetical protein